jgi:hypothetical protein
MTKIDVWNEFISKKKPPVWLGGWLILLWILLLQAPFDAITELSEYVDIINSGKFAMMTSKVSLMYVDWIFPLFLFEIMETLISIIFLSGLVYLYFVEHKLFPRLFKIFIIFSFIANWLYYILAYVLRDDLDILDDWKILMRIVWTFFWMLAWGLYISVSVRGKNTFIQENYRKRTFLSLLILFFIVISFFITLFRLDVSKLSFDDIEAWSLFCSESQWIYALYSWEKDDWWYMCECKDGFDFWEDDDNFCLPINRKPD